LLSPLHLPAPLRDLLLLLLLLLLPVGQAHSHVWIIYIFHKNTNSDRTLAHLPAGQTFPAKVQPPRRRGAAQGQRKLGVLATRTPHRPNPVGLSLGRLIEVDRQKRSLIIGGTDLVSDARAQTTDRQQRGCLARAPAEGQDGY
jgi:hypothetical protein